MLLLEFDVSLMILFLFQEHYGIYFANKETEEHSRGAYQGEWNMDFSDTECNVDKKVCYTWNSFFQAFQDK